MNSEHRAAVSRHCALTLADLQAAVNLLAESVNDNGANPADVFIRMADGTEAMALRLERVTLTDGSCVYDLKAG